MTAWLMGCLMGGYTLVGFESAAGELDDLAEQRHVVAGGDSECFQVTGAGGLDVVAAPGGPGQHRVHRQLVRTGVEAELVGAELSGQGGVVGERAVELLEVSLEVHALLEIADEARSETDQPDPVGQAAVGDDVVFGQGRWLVGFVDREFDLVILSGPTQLDSTTTWLDSGHSPARE